MAYAIFTIFSLCIGRLHLNFVITTQENTITVKMLFFDDIIRDFTDNKFPY